MGAEEEGLPTTYDRAKADVKSVKDRIRGGCALIRRTPSYSDYSYSDSRSWRAQQHHWAV